MTCYISYLDRIANCWTIAITEFREKINIQNCIVFLTDTDFCGRPWPAAYINIIQNTHQIRVLTEALCRAQAVFYSLPNNEWGTKYRGLTYSAK